MKTSENKILLNAIITAWFSTKWLCHLAPVANDDGVGLQASFEVHHCKALEPIVKHSAYRCFPILIKYAHTEQSERMPRGRRILGGARLFAPAPVRLLITVE